MIVLKAAMICDAATVRDGLLNVLGAGLSLFNRESYPAAFGAAVALILELSDGGESDQAHDIQVKAFRVGQADSAFFEVSAVLNAELVGNSGGFQLVPLALGLQNAGIPEEGAYELVVLIDGVNVTTLHFTATVESAQEQDDLLQSQDVSNPFG
jgi:hypothetical protein